VAEDSGVRAHLAGDVATGPDHPDGGGDAARGFPGRAGAVEMGSHRVLGGVERGGDAGVRPAG
jgi:hypothetical protein